MNLIQFLQQTLSLALGGSIIVLVAHYLIKDSLSNYLKEKQHQPKADDKERLLSLRLQAHERMIVFVDRINPSNLLVRVHQKDIEVNALQALVTNEIKAEFQHNITQQLYMENTTWKVIDKLKDDTIAMINNAVKHLPAEASGVALSKKVLQHMSQIEENPYELTIGLIKQDIHKMF